MAQLRIGELAKRAGVATSAIRYYEEVGLLPPAQRSENGYRLYPPHDVERLRFIQRAKALEFSLSEIGEILDLRERGEAPCAYVIEQIDHKMNEVRRKIGQLEQLQAELRLLQHEVTRLPADALVAHDCVCHIIENEQLTHLGELTGQGVV